MNVEEEVANLVSMVDQIRSSDLSEEDKKNRIDKIILKIREIRPKPSKHVGRGAIGNG